MKNIAQSGFTLADRTAILDTLTAAEQMVANGDLRALTAKERQKYGSVNEQNKLLINKVRDYQATAPQLSSPDVDWIEFASDYEMRAFYENCATRFHSLASQFESGKIQHDYDNHQDALDDYAYTQYKAGASAPGAAEKAAVLKVFFARSSNSPATPETPPENP